MYIAGIRHITLNLNHSRRVMKLNNKFNARAIELRFKLSVRIYIVSITGSGRIATSALEVYDPYF